MKVPLDECIDRRLARDIAGHDVKTVPQMGWAGIKNGDLLTLAEKQFEVFVTVDRNPFFSSIFRVTTSPSSSCVAAAIGYKICAL